MAAGDDPLWDDICETLLSLAKARPKPRPQRRRAWGTPKQVAYAQRLHAAACLKPPGQGTMAARALAALVPGAWLSLQDVGVRAGARPWLLAPELYKRLTPRGWVERIDDPDAVGRPIPGKGPRGPKKLWRLTALGEAMRATLLEKSTQTGDHR
ncbi:hypothetical protein ARD30_07705 [Bosea thiooxidans]|uniref:Uncharacterized protein n=1 Tax=Bosea thiooxidans TaxID=53254 RepID=A0A0Q3M8J6_9HYPH|nr:hypothetical protein [Bosea thiooxidans]KQK32137.1 hypothetical protein ARD30_07705 [Bosea thiooxidans]